MNKFKKVVLKNGLTLYLFNDNKKNTSCANIYTLAGGLDTHFIYDNIEYNQVSGIAHFLEHYLIEKSIYGNIAEIFSKDSIESNGITSSITTEYYITTVHDFEENYIKLLNIVNNPKFDENAIEDIRKPIVNEINKNLDQPYMKYGTFLNDCVYHNSRYNKSLGEIEDVINMSIEDIKVFYEAFYQPSNQIIVISGKFDEDKIIELTENEYNKFKREYKEVIKDKYYEPVTVNREEATFVDNNLPEAVDVRYKYDISSLTPHDKFKLSFYMSYYLDNNFGDKSESFDIVRENGYSCYSIDYGYYPEIEKDIFIIELGIDATNLDEVAKIIDKYVKNGKTSEESFKEFKNNVLLSMINKYENIFSACSKCIGDFFRYGYLVNDPIEEVKSFTYEECLEMISKFDYSNRTIVKRIKGE
ncbi:MAG: insulinase family protein [Bacilli bacterium]|nr:insulinase family protein [Bacilli bacterium]